MYYLVNKEKYGQICTCPMWFYVTLLDCVHFYNEIEKFQFSKSLKNFSIPQPMKNNVRCEYVRRKNVWFCFNSIVWVQFSHKTEKFWFWKSLKYLNVFWKRKKCCQILICPMEKYLILFHSYCLVSLYS